MSDASIPDLSLLSSETRAALCAQLLQGLAEETDYPDKHSPQRVVRAAILGYLRETSTLSLACTVRWHEGCSCHGSSEQETLEEGTLEEMGLALARHGHADGSDLDETRWCLRLSSAEEDVLRDTFNLETTKAARVEKAQGVLNKANKDLEMAALATQRMVTDLGRARHELLPEAIATREDEIRRASVAESALRAAAEEARAAVKAIA